MRTINMDVAQEIVSHLRHNGFGPDMGLDRQVLAMMEEAGEFVGAYRRWKGWARRSGTRSAVCAELADVVITTYVTAAEAGLNIDPTQGRAHVDRSPFDAVLEVFKAVTNATWNYPYLELSSVGLSDVVFVCRRAAIALEIELAHAVSDKLEIVFTRGWREPANT